MGGPGSGRFPPKPPGTHLGHSERARDERRAKRAAAQTESAESGVPQPRGNPAWHPIVKAWWKALADSDISLVAQKADWMNAWVAADVLDQMYDTGFTAGLMQQWTHLSEMLHAPRFDLLKITEAEPEKQDQDEAEADAGLAEIAQLFAVEDEGA